MRVRRPRDPYRVTDSLFAYGVGDSFVRVLENPTLTLPSLRREQDRRELSVFFWPNWSKRTAVIHEIKAPSSNWGGLGWGSQWVPIDDDVMPLAIINGHLWANNGGCKPPLRSSPGSMGERFLCALPS